MKNFLDNYFIPYWSQILVFLTVVGYLLSRSFKKTDERAFKRYELFQEKKLEATLKYYDLIGRFYTKAGKFLDQDGKPEDEIRLYFKELQGISSQLTFEIHNLTFYLSKDELIIYFKFANEASNFWFIASGQYEEIFYEAHRIGTPPDQTKFTTLLKPLASCLFEISKQTQAYYKNS